MQLTDKEGNPIWIRLTETSNSVIAPQYHEQIFRIFERLHGVESYPGTGIGLAIVQRGIERIGGRSGVESQVGQGSRFWIKLPVFDEESVASTSTAND